MTIPAEGSVVVAPTIGVMQTLSIAPGELQVNRTSKVAARTVSS